MKYTGKDSVLVGITDARNNLAGGAALFET